MLGEPQPVSPIQGLRRIHALGNQVGRSRPTAGVSHAEGGGGNSMQGWYITIMASRISPDSCSIASFDSGGLLLTGIYLILNGHAWLAVT